VQNLYRCWSLCCDKYVRCSRKFRGSVSADVIIIQTLNLSYVVLLILLTVCVLFRKGILTGPSGNSSKYFSLLNHIQSDSMLLLLDSVRQNRRFSLLNKVNILSLRINNK
jgi:hypothetical protein